MFLCLGYRFTGGAMGKGHGCTDKKTIRAEAAVGLFF
jgi:hypothetical protein